MSSTREPDSSASPIGRAPFGVRLFSIAVSASAALSVSSAVGRRSPRSARTKLGSVMSFSPVGAARRASALCISNVPASTAIKRNIRNSRTTRKTVGLIAFHLDQTTLHQSPSNRVAAVRV